MQALGLRGFSVKDDLTLKITSELSKIMLAFGKNLLVLCKSTFCEGDRGWGRKGGDINKPLQQPPGRQSFRAGTCFQLAGHSKEQTTTLGHLHFQSRCETGRLLLSHEIRASTGYRSVQTVTELHDQRKHPEEITVTYPFHRRGKC